MRYPWPLWLIPVVLISPAAFLIPVDVFTRYPWVEAYAHGLAKVIPMIDRAAHLYPHPQQFKAFFAYAWSWLPLCLVLAWFEQFKYKPRIEQGIREFPLVMVMMVFLFVIAIIWFAPEGPLFGTALMSHGDSRTALYSSRISLFLTAAPQIYVVAYLQTCVVAYVRIGWANRPQYDIGPK
jgi:hypothetical protein